MATIQINGTDLLPQPAQAEWSDEVIQGNLAGIDAIGAYKILTIQAPILAGQTYNWDSFENQVLTSMQAYAPGDLPTGSAVVYSSGVVSKKIERYRMEKNRTVSGIEMKILVVV